MIYFKWWIKSFQNPHPRCAGQGRINDERAWSLMNVMLIFFSISLALCGLFVHAITICISSLFNRMNFSFPGWKTVHFKRDGMDYLGSYSPKMP